MRKLTLLFASLLAFTFGAHAQTYIDASRIKGVPDCSNATTGKVLYNLSTRTFSCGTDQTGGGGSAVTVQDEGSNLTTNLTAINFVGAGITCAGSSPVTCTVSGASAGNAAADGTTKGIASFAAADFNDNGSGNISIDYSNGQSASGSQKGFLTSGDWTTFNNKQSAITFGTGVQAALGNNLGSAGAPLVFGGALNGTTLALTGSTTCTPTAMGAGTAIDTSKCANTKSVSANTTFTFNSAPTAGTVFELRLTSDATARQITLPSFHDMVRNITATTFIIQPSTTASYFILYDGSTYHLTGPTGYINNVTATAAPGTSDDVSKGYGPGSIWYDATGNHTYICEANTSTAAVWTQIDSGGSAVDDTAYNATFWDGVTATAPSKNAVRDRFEAIAPGGVAASASTLAANGANCSAGNAPLGVDAAGAAEGCFAVGTKIASGTSALGTSAITSGACATVVTTAATGVATTDVVNWGFNGDPTAITGYSPSANGMLTIIAYPSANNVNFKVCNNTAESITPGAITLNWNVVR